MSGSGQIRSLRVMSAARPPFPHEQIFAGTHRTAVSCHNRAHTPQQTARRLHGLLDELVSSYKEGPGHGDRWAWRPQEGPQQALVVRLRSFVAPVTCMPNRGAKGACTRESHQSNGCFAPNYGRGACWGRARQSTRRSTCPMLRRRTDAASWQGTSPPAQPRDEGACPGELLFVKRRAWRIATIAHCFDRLIDLAERSRRHGGVLPPLSKEHQSESLVATSPGPLERVTLRGVFFQRFAIRSDGLFQFPGSALALPEPEERDAQVVLGHGPVAREALARSFLQRLAISNDSLFQPCRSALALPEAEQRIAQVALGLSPG